MSSTDMPAVDADVSADETANVEASTQPEAASPSPVKSGEEKCIADFFPKSEALDDHLDGLRHANDIYPGGVKRIEEELLAGRYEWLDETVQAALDKDVSFRGVFTPLDFVLNRVRCQAPAHFPSVCNTTASQ